MIKFFRTIRQKLLSEDKNGKYLKYAIGEIILVVIGILIALQINNWNDQRKERNFEQKILQEIQAALKADINIQRKGVLFYIERAENSIIELVKMKESKGYPRDSVNYHLTNLREAGVFFKVNTGPYETLKARGLDKISNAALRYKVTNLYSAGLPAMAIWINDVIRPYINAKNELFEAVFEPNTIIDDKGKLGVSIDLSDFENKLKSPQFNLMLKKISDVLPSTIDRLKASVRKMEETVMAIEMELNN